jgi:hypothetical protein
MASGKHKKNSSMKHLLIAFLLFNAILSTLCACGSGPKPVHYGVFQAPKTSVPASTNSVTIPVNKVSGIK